MNKQRGQTVTRARGHTAPHSALDSVLSSVDLCLVSVISPPPHGAVVLWSVVQLMKALSDGGFIILHKYSVGKI